jgi:hypothetical protein
MHVTCMCGAAGAKNELCDGRPHSSCLHCNGVGFDAAALIKRHSTLIVGHLAYGTAYQAVYSTVQYSDCWPVIGCAAQHCSSLALPQADCPVRLCQTGWSRLLHKTSVLVDVAPQQLLHKTSVLVDVAPQQLLAC